VTLDELGHDHDDIAIARLRRIYCFGKQADGGVKLAVYRATPFS